MPISQNTALFSILGTNYGGNGTTTFALPNLQGSAPLQAGQGVGLSEYDLGQSGGQATVTLDGSEAPSHSHAVQVNSAAGTLPSPSPSAILGASAGVPVYQDNVTQDLTPMAPQSIGTVGGGQPHDNMQPYLTLNFCIAIQGIFPPRS